MKTSHADTEVCTISDIGIEITGSDAPPFVRPGTKAAGLVAAINDYLSIFAKPVRRKGGASFLGKFECLNCGEPLGGMLSHFRWGIVHGEGECSCGWPCRAYHRPKDDDGEIFDRPLEIILQYHPSGVAVRTDENETP